MSQNTAISVRKVAKQYAAIAKLKKAAYLCSSNRVLPLLSF